MIRRGASAIAGFALLASLAPAAWGQKDPKFEYGKKEEAKGVEWKAAAQAGLIITSGNSRTTTMSAGAIASRKAGSDKLSLDFAMAYARSDIQIAADTNGVPGIGPGEIQRVEQTTTNLLLFKGRYDRFLTEKNSLYVVGIIGRDRPAGKEVAGGGQVGYSRVLVAAGPHEVVSEVGYDFTYEDYVADVDSLAIHSARGFVGYVGALTETTKLDGSAELLANLNTETTPAGEVGAFEDDRFTGKVGLTTKLSEAISFRFAFTAKFDSEPAPRPPFPGIPFEAGYVPLADELDTITEAQLIINLL
jgi:hypothetical protein